LRDAGSCSAATTVISGIEADATLNSIIKESINMVMVCN